MKEILPVLDTKVLQEKANEFAMKGAIESIKEYYSGYSSPFRKAIDAELANKPLSGTLDLPDIIAQLNKSLTQEIDAIANMAVAKTFIPQVKEFLTREEPEMKFSEFLKRFIELTDAKDYDDCRVSVLPHPQYVSKPMVYDWLEVSISNSEKTYNITFHKAETIEKDKDPKRRRILMLPWKDSKKSMYFEFEVGRLEIPFMPGVLEDKFTSFIARLVICGTVITMDTDEFDESMFPERCHCD